MKGALITMLLGLTLALSAPVPVWASWWGWGGDNEPLGLDLEGYDANTVVTVSGRITAIRSDETPQVQLDIDTGKRVVVVYLGPRGYWNKHGIPLTVGDLVTVRGSKAQGGNGVVYVLAQKISAADGAEVALRSDSGRPAWSGGGRGGFGGGAGGQMRQHAPTRMMGGGRMGR